MRHYSMEYRGGKGEENRDKWLDLLISVHIMVVIEE